MTDICDISSPAVALYIHKFVEWDIESDKYISKFDRRHTKEKQAEIQDIIYLGASLIELELLYSIEEDPVCRRSLKKAINTLKNSPCRPF